MHSVRENSVRVWCLLGKKAGDNTQVRALARALGLGWEEKHIRARPWELLVHIGPRATLAGIDRSRSSPLRPPWPDIVLTAGRRNEPVAHWIRRAAGDACHLVHIGRPWSALDSWDLIVTTPQYFLPEHRNIVHNSLPLHDLSGEERDRAGTDLQTRVGHLPHPWIAVLLGGDSGRFVLTPAKGARLGRLLEELASYSGGSLLVTDSPRTPRASGDALQRELRTPHFYYRWHSGEDNPYRDMLAVADAFVVTGESMSMLAEAAAMQRPLFIFDTGDGDDPWWRHRHNFRYKPLSHRLAMALGPRRMRREIGNIQTALVESGQARWLSEQALNADLAMLNHLPNPEAAGKSTAHADLNRAVAAVSKLLT